MAEQASLSADLLGERLILLLVFGCFRKGETSFASDRGPLFTAIQLVKLRVSLKVANYLPRGLQYENLLIWPEA